MQAKKKPKTLLLFLSLCEMTAATNECSSNPCLNEATCVDRVAQYLCVCAPGYDGTNCEEGKSVAFCFYI